MAAPPGSELLVSTYVGNSEHRISFDWGEPYTRDHYEHAQALDHYEHAQALQELRTAPGMEASILMRSTLLGLYAEQRDLFLRPECCSTSGAFSSRRNFC